MSITFEKYLEEIRNAKGPLSAAGLPRLSNLSPENKSKLLGFWPTLEPSRKERLARSLIQLAEDNVELNFEDVFRLCLTDRNSAVRVAGIEGLGECTTRWFMDNLILVAREDES